MRMSGLRLITFDITNTVLKVRGSPGLQYAALARTCGIHSPPAEDLDRVYRPVFRQYRQERPNYGLQLGMSSQQWWTDFMKKVYIEAGYTGDVSAIQNLTLKVWDNFADSSAWEVLPSSHDSLKQLKEKGLQLGVISNFDERLTGILRGHRLAEFFDFVVTSVEAGCEKPDPKIFHHALSVAKTPAHQAVHVGDDVEFDYWAARNVGMHSYLLDQKGKLSPEDLGKVNGEHVIRQLKDLDDLFP